MMHIYDGNNVIIRAMTGTILNGPKINIRQRLAFADATQIWVWDGLGHNKRRQEIYPDYKMNRRPMAEDIFAQINLFKDLLQHTPAIQITAPGWEADDVIHTIVKRWNMPLTIHTNDVDYLQLARFPHVTLNGVSKPPCDPRWVPLYKALVGDPSDNIKGISGFGKKAWDETEGYREELETAIRVGSPHSFHVLPMPKPLLRWIDLPGNLEVLQSMLLITHMWDVPQSEIDAGITAGVPNPAHINNTLRKFFL